jgi:hypothetical protein
MFLQGQRMTKASASVRSSAFDLERAPIPAATHQSTQIFGALGFSWGWDAGSMAAC